MLAVIAAVVLSACAPGADPASATTTASAAAASQAAPTSGQFPVTVEHVYGQTVIPAEPQRVITLGLSDQDPLLALGVKPVAVYPWWGDYPYATWPWAQDELGDAQPVVLNKGVRDEANPPVEEIASLEPDLIISLYNGTTKEQYEQLSQIAPVVVPDEQYANFAITWQEATRATGEALGREAEAVALVEQLERSFADAAEAHPEFAGKTAVVAERFEAGETIVRTGNDVRAKFFEQLGFTIPTEVAGIAPNAYGELYVPDELVTELSKDLLVWNVGFAPDARATVEALPLYGQLPVVQDQRVLWVEDPVVSGAFSWGTVLSLQYALDELLPQVSETLS
ncbi:iron complex transport system substrate-binding protein [Quadrisphaera granulorum]|uniref:Iron complex transport system substrate-binding protein n=2 Tax=Quadrisphaera granulorum TaxID=317664 RepID=A0A316AFD6_9ACTN|nr:iron complex transport system substrate-binding protein [Quadrisphaera granulorum]SZE95129.1 iron complex transport system substrate-binding protein [Quadrisphaera granulorum]